MGNRLTGKAQGSVLTLWSRGLERSILRFSGVAPVRETLFGRVDAAGDATQRRWLDRMREYGGRSV